MFGSLSPWKEEAMIPGRERFTRSLMRFEEEMEDLMGRMFGGDVSMSRYHPMADLVEGEQDFTVKVDLPGMTAEDVNVEVKEGDLWITGERKEEKEEHKPTYHRTERRYGQFRRVFSLPKMVDEDGIEARFANGVLTVRVPKSEEAKPKHIEVTS